MRPPRVAWRPPPSKVYHRLHRSYWSPDGETRYAPCGAVLDCPAYRSKEGMPREARLLGRRPCSHPQCRLIKEAR